MYTVPSFKYDYDDYIKNDAINLLLSRDAVDSYNN
jgi:hypothetical protein